MICGKVTDERAVKFPMRRSTLGPASSKSKLLCGRPDDDRVDAASALAGLAFSGIATAEDKVVRIGFQKYGNVVLLKGKGTLEPRAFARRWSRPLHAPCRP